LTPDGVVAGGEVHHQKPT